MAKKKPPGTWVERDLYESKAFLSLRGFAPQLLILFLGKRQFEYVGKEGRQQHLCINQDSITFTYIEAQKKYGLGIARMFRAIDELLAKGFIEIKRRGGHCQKDKTVYAISERWRLWRPGETIFKREKDSVQRGFRQPKRSKVVPLKTP